jgi:hypothetical protein
MSAGKGSKADLDYGSALALPDKLIPVSHSSAVLGVHNSYFSN